MNVTTAATTAVPERDPQPTSLVPSEETSPTKASTRAATATKARTTVDISNGSRRDALVSYGGSNQRSARAEQEDAGGDDRCPEDLPSFPDHLRIVGVRDAHCHHQDRQEQGADQTRSGTSCRRKRPAHDDRQAR